MLEVMVKFIKDQGDLKSLSSSGTDRTNQKSNSSRYHIMYNNTYLKASLKHNCHKVLLKAHVDATMASSLYEISLQRITVYC